MRRPLLTLLLCAAAALGACARPKVQLTVDFQLTTDGGAPLECSTYADLACVNFIKFQIEEDGNLTPPLDCITVDKRLATLCDVTQLEHGSQIFRYDRDARVRIRMWGLRVFPATSCEINPECQPRILFTGVTDWAKAGDVPGGKLPLTITEAHDCGRKEYYEPRGTRTCDSVCQYSPPVCDMHEGCVCLVQDDAGTPRSNGAWEPLDAGVD